jgi:nitrate/TMAO reductase-like tetraheme cytochrome c subunit
MVGEIHAELAAPAPRSDTSSNSNEEKQKNILCFVVLFSVAIASHTTTTTTTTTKQSCWGCATMSELLGEWKAAIEGHHTNRVAAQCRAGWAEWSDVHAALARG